MNRVFCALDDDAMCGTYEDPPRLQADSSSSTDENRLHTRGDFESPLKEGIARIEFGGSEMYRRMESWNFK